MSFGHQMVSCKRCGGERFPVAQGHVCPDLGPVVVPYEIPTAPPPPAADNGHRQALADARATMAHLVGQMKAAGNRERMLTATLERLFQFTAGLQLGDQPIAVQREREAIKHAVVAVLSPPCAISDSYGDARAGGGGGGGGTVRMVLNGAVVHARNVSWKVPG